MKTVFKMTGRFLRDVRHDLARPHAFASERIGFISIRAAGTANNLILLAEGYHPVDDDDYINDPTVGAMMSQEAIRKALNIALLQSVGMFHVHMHDHLGRPSFSHIDLREQRKFVPDFFKICHEMPHGATVLSYDNATGRLWLSPEKVVGISEFNIVGPRLSINIAEYDENVDGYA